VWIDPSPEACAALRLRPPPAGTVRSSYPQSAAIFPGAERDIRTWKAPTGVSGCGLSTFAGGAAAAAALSVRRAAHATYDTTDIGEAGHGSTRTANQPDQQAAEQQIDRMPGSIGI